MTHLIEWFGSLRTSRLLGCHLLHFNKHWVNKMVKSTCDFRWGMRDTLHFFKCGNVGISSYSIMINNNTEKFFSNISMQNKALLFGGSANNLEAPRVGSSFLFFLYFLLLEGHYSQTVIFTVGPAVVCLRESCM